MQLEQLPQGHPLEGSEAPAVLVAKELLGVPRSEALNHTSSIQRHALYVKQRLLRSHLKLWETNLDFSTDFHSLTNSSQSRQPPLILRLPALSFEFACRRSNNLTVNI